MKPRRLCVVTTHPIQYMAPWYRALAREAPIEIDVVFLREPDARQQGEGFGLPFAWDVPLREGYRSTVLDVAAGWSRVPALWRRLRAHWRRDRPDAVLITGWNEPALVAAYPLVVLAKLPVLVRAEANLLCPPRWYKRVLHRLLLRMAAAAVEIGRANREFYLASGMPADRVFPGAYFVDSERMLQMAQAHGSQRPALRKACGHGAEDFVFCFVGKHVPSKRPMLLVEAASLLRARGLRVALHIAGSGELTGHLRRRALELGVPAHFTGFLNQSELWRAYVPADGFVLPSDCRETWGLVTNEAMLFGLPVIVGARAGCAPDLVRDGETGYRFDGGAPQLAEAMARLAADPAAARDMGRRGRELVAGQYSMGKATRGLLAALEAVAP